MLFLITALFSLQIRFVIGNLKSHTTVVFEKGERTSRVCAKGTGGGRGRGGGGGGCK